jgi:D-alanyl-D-alanine carboxypeptidase (penicillin-binding protein 5/6)
MVNKDRYGKSFKKALIAKLTEDNSDEKKRNVDCGEDQNSKDQNIASQHAEDPPSKHQSAKDHNVEDQNIEHQNEKSQDATHPNDVNENMGNRNSEQQTNEPQQGKHHKDVSLREKFLNDEYQNDKKKNNQYQNRRLLNHMLADSKESVSPDSSQKPQSTQIFIKTIKLFVCFLIICGVAFLALQLIQYFQRPRYDYIGPLKHYEKTSFEIYAPKVSASDQATLENDINLQTWQDLTRCRKKGQSSEPDIDADAYMVVFVEDFQVAIQKNAKQKTSFASITKLLGALVALDHYSLEEELSLLEKIDTAGNGLDLELDEKMTVENLLAAALVGSRNDAMAVLAQNYPEGEQGFVEAMNQKAKILGMSNTSIENPIGFDSENQYSTPNDITILSIAAMQRDFIREYVKQKQITVYTVDQRSIRVKSTNPLIGEMNRVVGLKTGYTAKAGLCLVSYVDADPDYIIIVLNAEDRAIASENLINWVEDNYDCE